MISRVIHSELHLTPDHSSGIATYLNLTDLEAEYFETLLHYNRAASPHYKSRLLRRLSRLRESSSDLARVFESPQIDSVEAQNFYYASWIPAAVHIACAVKNLNSPLLIANRLGLPIQEVTSTLDRLKDLGLLLEDGGKFSLSEKFLHISKNSFLISAHHSHWRNQAIANCQKRDQTALHFTGVFAVGRPEFERLKEQIQSSLEKSKEIVGDSQEEEELICLSIDAFRIGN